MKKALIFGVGIVIVIAIIASSFISLFTKKIEIPQDLSPIKRLESPNKEYKIECFWKESEGQWWITTNAKSGEKIIFYDFDIYQEIKIEFEDDYKIKITNSKNNNSVELDIRKDTFNGRVSSKFRG